jgi:hypothetical protein
MSGEGILIGLFQRDVFQSGWRPQQALPVLRGGVMPRVA